MRDDDEEMRTKEENVEHADDDVIDEQIEIKICALQKNVEDVHKNMRRYFLMFKKLLQNYVFIRECPCRLKH